MTIKVTLIFSYSWVSKHQISKAFRADICGIVWTGSYFYLFLSKTFFDIWNLRPLIIVTTNFKVYNTISTSAKNQSLQYNNQKNRKAKADEVTDFCETLISISKLRLSRKTVISFSISTLNFVVRTLILILNSHSQTLKNLRHPD